MHPTEYQIFCSIHVSSFCEHTYTHSLCISHSSHTSGAVWVKLLFAVFRFSLFFQNVVVSVFCTGAALHTYIHGTLFQWLHTFTCFSVSFAFASHEEHLYLYLPFCMHAYVATFFHDTFQRKQQQTYSHAYDWMM